MQSTLQPVTPLALLKIKDFATLETEEIQFPYPAAAFPIHRDHYSSSPDPLTSATTSEESDPLGPLILDFSKDTTTGKTTSFDFIPQPFLHHLDLKSPTNNPLVRRQGDHIIDNYRNLTGETVTRNGVTVHPSNITINIIENTVTLYLNDDLQYLLPATCDHHPTNPSPAPITTEQGIQELNLQLAQQEYQRQAIEDWKTGNYKNTAPTWNIKYSPTWQAPEEFVVQQQQEIDYFNFKKVNTVQDQSLLEVPQAFPRSSSAPPQLSPRSSDLDPFQYHLSPRSTLYGESAFTAFIDDYCAYETNPLTFVERINIFNEALGDSWRDTASA